MLERIVWDKKYSVRHFDENGYMHVEMTPISKATVNPYKGSELQGLTEEKLDPDKIYYGYRDPDELAKGAETFNGLFLLDEHHDIDAVNIPKEYIVGTVGTDANFKDGYLFNSLTIADAEAIKRVKDGTQWEISSAYRFKPVFKEGEVEMGGDKIHYDFVMTEIRGNHVALVPEGRAGHDVRVADSKENVMDAENKKDKVQVRNAEEMNFALDCIGACALEDFKSKVNSNDTYDIKVVNEIKNSRGELTAVVCGNKEHQFIVGYDSYGHLDAEELINDAMACKVREGVCLGKKAKEEEENAKKAFKYDVQQAVKEQTECPVASAVAEAPIGFDPKNGGQEKIMADPERLVHEALAEKTEQVIMVGDEAMVTAGNAGVPATAKKKVQGQSIADTEGAKGMGDNIKREDGSEAIDERDFGAIKEALENTAYKCVDQLVAELNKCGAQTGLTKVVSAGEQYSIECTKGEKKFTVEYTQAPNCVEITTINDDGDADFANDQEPDDDVTEEADETIDVEDGGIGSGRKKGSKNKNSKMTFTSEEKGRIKEKANARIYSKKQRPDAINRKLRHRERMHAENAKAGEEILERITQNDWGEMSRPEYIERRKKRNEKLKNNARLARRLREGLDAKPKGLVHDALPVHSVYELLVKVLAEDTQKTADSLLGTVAKKTANYKFGDMD